MTRCSTVWLAALIAGCSGGAATPTDAGNTVDSGVVDAGNPYLGIFHRAGAVLDDGGFQPAASADNVEFKADGTYRGSSRGCLAAGTSMGAWQLRDAGVFVPDDKPANPGRVFSTVVGSGGLDERIEEGALIARWGPGGVCNSGCDAGVASIIPCADPQW
jgi:hypothetical protein